LADSIYWTTYSAVSDADEIRRASLAGAAAGGTAETVYAGVGLVRGLAIDPAAGRIYWASYTEIKSAPIGGAAAGGSPETLYNGPTQGVDNAWGVAINPAAGRVYWTNGNDHSIRSAPVAGADAGGIADPLYDSRHGVSYPSGLAIDPAAGRIYWGDSSFAKIYGAPLAGAAAGGTVGTLYDSTHGVRGPTAVAVNPPPGPEQLEVVRDTERFATGGRLGSALDWARDLIRPSPGQIYWGNWDNSLADGKIRGAPLTGAAAGGSPDTLYDSTHGVSLPTGLAIDPNPGPGPEQLEVVRETERFTTGGWLGGALNWARDLFPRPTAPPAQIYWSNGFVPAMGGQPPNPSNKTIQRAPLAGSGAVDTLYGGSAIGTGLPVALALLRAPVGIGAPTISSSFALDAEDPFGDWHFGGGHSGALNQQLTCSFGSWAPDLPGCLLYRAPQSFAYQWMHDGIDIAGETANNYTTGAPGDYTCRVTASNHAGGAAQTSVVVTIH
jgi:hypothetical protein